VKVLAIVSLYLLAALASLSCRGDVVCPAILRGRLTLPETTTIKVGASSIAIAGASWGGCETGPPAPDFVWKTSDSSIASVLPLHSLHASIQGRHPGVAIVTPTYRSGRSSPSSVEVTVVP